MRRREATSLERTRRVVPQAGHLVGLASQVHSIPPTTAAERTDDDRTRAGTTPVRHPLVSVGWVRALSLVGSRCRHGTETVDAPPAPSHRFPRGHAHSAPHCTTRRHRSARNTHPRLAPGARPRRASLVSGAGSRARNPVPVCVRSVVWLRNSRRALSISNGLRNIHKVAKTYVIKLPVASKRATQRGCSGSPARRQVACGGGEPSASATSGWHTPGERKACATGGSAGGSARSAPPCTSTTRGRGRSPRRQLLRPRAGATPRRRPRRWRRCGPRDARGRRRGRSGSGSGGSGRRRSRGRRSSCTCFSGDPTDLAVALNPVWDRRVNGPMQ